MFRRKPCESLAEAANKPEAVRRLRLIQSGVNLSVFAALVPQLTEVREINLGWQDWTELPRELSKLPELRTLTVLNTPIQDFPDFLAGCPRLTELVLRGTHISSIPASGGTFQLLRRLDFSNNPARVVPPELGQLQNLREVQLADLQLKSLPNSVARLRRLRRLLLANNCFNANEASQIRSWFRRGVADVWGTDELSN